MTKDNRNIDWIIIKAQVKEIFNTDLHLRHWEYRLNIDDDRVSRIDRVKHYKLVHSHFSKKTAPRVGDWVVLKHTLEPEFPDFDYTLAKIYSIWKE